MHNIARVTRDDAKVSKALLLLLEPLVQTAGDKGVAFLLAACADMSGHDDASGLGPCPFDHIRVSELSPPSTWSRCRVDGVFMSPRRLDAVDAAA